MFALDSHALDHNMDMCRKIQPEFIEILPGIIPSIIKEIQNATAIPVITGGLIRTQEDVDMAIKSGAHAVTIYNVKLW